MVTSFNFQRHTINKALKAKGIDADLFDTRAHIDKTLSLEENFTNIVGRRQQRQSTSSVSKIDNYLAAQEHFNNLKPKRQMMDARINARKTFEQDQMTNKNYKTWRKNPNRYDVAGIDTRY